MILMSNIMLLEIEFLQNQLEFEMHIMTLLDLLNVLGFMN